MLLVFVHYFDLILSFVFLFFKSLVPKWQSNKRMARIIEKRRKSQSRCQSRKTKDKNKEKLSPEELRDKRSHRGELNNWDPAQLPIAREL